MVCIGLKRVNLLTKKGLTSFSSAGPRLILVGCKWCFYSGGMGHICDKCEDYHMSYKELIVCERCCTSDTLKSDVHCLLAFL